MKYELSNKYADEKYLSKIMGPNPLKLTEELMLGLNIPRNGVVCDLGSGQGLTSLFLAKEYGFKVYAADLWSNPEENRRFFRSEGLTDDEILPVKADATALPFEKGFFDAVICVDSYNYFGRDPAFLDEKLLPFVKNGGYIYIAVPGMKKDCHEHLPAELLLHFSGADKFQAEGISRFFEQTGDFYCIVRVLPINEPPAPQNFCFVFLSNQ